MSARHADRTFSWRMPDPRASDARPSVFAVIVVHENAYRHFLTKHVIGGRWEPWADSLGDSLVAALRDQPATIGREVLDHVMAGLRVALEYPRVLLRDLLPRKHQFECWHVVLPSGAWAVIRSRPGGPGHLATCFFGRSACRERDPRARWFIAARSLMLLYAVDWERSRVVNEPSAPASAAGSAAYSHIRLVSPEAFGVTDDGRIRLRRRGWSGEELTDPTAAASIRLRRHARRAWSHNDDI